MMKFVFLLLGIIVMNAFSVSGTSHQNSSSVFFENDASPYASSFFECFKMPLEQEAEREEAYKHLLSWLFQNFRNHPIRQIDADQISGKIKDVDVTRQQQILSILLKVVETSYPDPSSYFRGLYVQDFQEVVFKIIRRWPNQEQLQRILGQNQKMWVLNLERILSDKSYYHPFYAVSLMGILTHSEDIATKSRAVTFLKNKIQENPQENNHYLKNYIQAGLLSDDHELKALTVTDLQSKISTSEGLYEDFIKVTLPPLLESTSESDQLLGYGLLTTWMDKQRSRSFPVDGLLLLLMTPKFENEGLERLKKYCDGYYQKPACIRSILGKTDNVQFKRYGKEFLEKTVLNPENPMYKRVDVLYDGFFAYSTLQQEGAAYLHKILASSEPEENKYMFLILLIKKNLNLIFFEDQVIQQYIEKALQSYFSDSARPVYEIAALYVSFFGVNQDLRIIDKGMGYLDQFLSLTVDEKTKITVLQEILEKDISPVLQNYPLFVDYQKKAERDPCFLSWKAHVTTLNRLYDRLVSTLQSNHFDKKDWVSDIIPKTILQGLARNAHLSKEKIPHLIDLLSKVDWNDGTSDIKNPSANTLIGKMLVDGMTNIYRYDLLSEGNIEHQEFLKTFVTTKVEEIVQNEAFLNRVFVVELLERMNKFPSQFLIPLWKKLILYIQHLDEDDLISLLKEKVAQDDFPEIEHAALERLEKELESLTLKGLMSLFFTKKDLPDLLIEKTVNHIDQKIPTMTPEEFIYLFSKIEHFPPLLIEKILNHIEKEFPNLTIRDLIGFSSGIQHFPSSRTSLMDKIANYVLIYFRQNIEILKRPIEPLMSRIAARKKEIGTAITLEQISQIQQQENAKIKQLKQEKGDVQSQLQEAFELLLTIYDKLLHSSLKEPLRELIFELGNRDDLGLLLQDRALFLYFAYHDFPRHLFIPSSSPYHKSHKGVILGQSKTFLSKQNLPLMIRNTFLMVYASMVKNASSYEKSFVDILTKMQDFESNITGAQAMIENVHDRLVLNFTNVLAKKLLENENPSKRYLTSEQQTEMLNDIEVLLNHLPEDLKLTLTSAAEILRKEDYIQSAKSRINIMRKAKDGDPEASGSQWYRIADPKQIIIPDYEREDGSKPMLTQGRAVQLAYDVIQTQQHNPKRYKDLLMAFIEILGSNNVMSACAEGAIGGILRSVQSLYEDDATIVSEKFDKQDLLQLQLKQLKSLMILALDQWRQGRKDVFDDLKSGLFPLISPDFMHTLTAENHVMDNFLKTLGTLDWGHILGDLPKKSLYELFETMQTSPREQKILQDIETLLIAPSIRVFIYGQYKPFLMNNSLKMNDYMAVDEIEVIPCYNSHATKIQSFVRGHQARK